MLSEITDLIGPEDSKGYLVGSLGNRCFSFKLACLSRILENEFFRSLFSDKPLPPNFHLLRVPETSGSDDASSKHPYVGFDRDFLPSVQPGRGSRLQDIHDQSIQLDENTLTRDVFSRNKQEGLRLLLNGLRIA